MESIEEIVHVIPLGHEIDRAVKPFERLKTNRVYLLAITQGQKYSLEMIERQKYFLDVVKKKLEKKGIEVQVKNVDMFNILEVMKNVAGIILKEKLQNNIVYVNMSACGRLTSVGATLAAMAHDARIYYVVADRYSKTEEEENIHGLSICDRLRVVYLENFRLRLPDEISLTILIKLCERDKGLKTKEILDLLGQMRIKGFEEDYTRLIGQERRKTQIRQLMKLNKGILDRLERSGYITRVKTGRYNTIKITESGKYVAYISGLFKQTYTR